MAIQQVVDTYGEPDYNPDAISVACEGNRPPGQMTLSPSTQAAGVG
jgi:hypothetical protein